MRIGIVDIDTSHPRNWIPIERELGHEIVGLYDAGEVHPKSYVTQFAQEHAIPVIYDSLEQMANDVDCAIIHSCNWDSHLIKAQPFINAGKSVLLDKPMAGNHAELEHLCRLVKNGIRITGGSSLRFCNEIQQWLSLPLEQRGCPHTVISGCAKDNFNYGIHAYSALCGIMGPGIESVRYLGDAPQFRVEICWNDGRIGLVIVGDVGKWLPFYMTIVTDRCVHQFQPATGDLYKALLLKTLPYLAGDTDVPPVQMEELIEPELAALAAMASMQQDGAKVFLKDLPKLAPNYDGRAFVEEYRKTIYK